MTVGEGGGGPRAGNLIILQLAARGLLLLTSSLFKTTREALTDLDALAPV